MWLRVLLVIEVLAGAAFAWYKVNSDRDVVGCIHCGKCLEAGECVMVKKRKAPLKDAEGSKES